MTLEKLSALPSGHIIKREVVDGKNYRHIIVKPVRVMTCDICGEKCREKVVKVKNGNIDVTTSCPECTLKEYK